MKLSDWAAAPLTSGPPPIPLNTDTAPSDASYYLGAIPPEAIAEDLAALGLTFSDGRGNGYKIAGERIDWYQVGDLIAGVFADAAAILNYFLDTDETMIGIADNEAQLARIPFKDVRLVDRDHDPLTVERREISRRIETAEAVLPIKRIQLALAAESLAATAAVITRDEQRRREALRRFRSVMPAPSRPPRLASADAVSAFLATVPPGLIVRSDLHGDAAAAGVVVGSRTLYAAADALGWKLSRRRGIFYYVVPA